MKDPTQDIITDNGVVNLILIKKKTIQKMTTIQSAGQDSDEVSEYSPLR